ncbi:MAG: DUF1573 domain-containing protein [Thermoanaerobaculia bacterium]|nr:DUF1573 domain-containing protein [Thermoanaerobaculia bacterium]
MRVDTEAVSTVARRISSGGSLTLLAATLLVAPLFGQGGPSVSVDRPVADVGIVQSGSTVEHTFTLRNDGDASLEILEVDPDCGCTVAEYDAVIPPGASGRITAVMDVTAFVGPIAKYLRVVTNDRQNPELTLAIKAEVRPQVRIDPGYVRFLTVVGAGAERADQTIWADDIPNFEIHGVRSPYPFVEARARPATEEEESASGQGRQWIVEVALAPDAPVGPMADHLEIRTNHPDRSVMRIPVSGFVRPVLAASPPLVDFGQREVSGPVHASIQIKNFGEEAVEILGLTSDLPGLDGRVEPDGHDFYLYLTLSPGLPKGDFSGKVVVETTSERVPELEIDVRGTIL